MAVYTLFGQAATGSDPAVADATSYNFAVQFSVSSSATLTAIWFYSPSGAVNLPANIALYNVASTSVITSQAASWSGAAGSGWVRAAWTSPPALTAGTSYKAGVEGGGANWYSATTGYWTTGGAGAGGITNGPLTAPNETGASPGQDSYILTSTITYPSTDSGSANYWVDPEVTVAASLSSGPNFPSTGAGLAGGTGTWANPGNITADDGAAAVWTV